MPEVAHDGPLFSVIIPAFNREESVLDTLRSLEEQKFVDYEVLVVDNGSIDRTREVVLQFAVQRPQMSIRLLEQPKPGAGAARNLGAKHARGAYLGFLDSDDLWLPWTLSMMAHLVAPEAPHEPPVFLNGCYLPFRGPIPSADGDPEPSAFSTYPTFFDAPVTELWWNGSTLVVRKDVFLAAGGYREDPGINNEDTQLCLSLGDAGPFVQIEAPTTTAFRVHDTGLYSAVGKSVQGVMQLFEGEAAGCWPGGDRAADARRALLAHRARQHAFRCATGGDRAAAWRLYRLSFSLQWRLKRWRFLVGLPVLTLASLARRARP